MADSELIDRKIKLAKFKEEEKANLLGVPKVKIINIESTGEIITLKNGENQDLIVVEGKEKLWRPAAESLKKMLNSLILAGYGYDLSDSFRPIGSPGDGKYYADGVLGEATQWATYEIYRDALEAFIKGEENPSYKSDPFYKKYIKYVNNASSTPGTSYHGYGLAIDIFIKNHGTVVGTVKSGAYLQKDFNKNIITPKKALQDETQKWIANNGITYGWIWTGENFSPPEAWHFEYDINKDSTKSQEVLAKITPQQKDKITQTQQASIFDFKLTTKSIKSCFINPFE